MNKNTNYIRASGKRLTPLLRRQPGIRIDLRSADHMTTAAIMAVMIGKGINTAPAIYNYLSNRGCPHDFNTVQFILDAYNGSDSRQCVWTRDNAGRYTPLTQGKGYPIN